MMFIRMISGSLALLAFSTAIFAGIWAGNEVTTVLLRAWGALILFLVFGALIGWMAKIVIDEHLAQSSHPDGEESRELKPPAARSESPETVKAG